MTATDDSTSEDDVNTTLETWLAEFYKPKDKRSKLHQDYNFPTDAIRDEYLASISHRPEHEIKMLLEHFLIEPGVLGADYDNLAFMRSGAVPRKPDETQYRKRLWRVLDGDSNVLPWEGVTWVLDLLRVEPKQAVNVLNAYLVTHIIYLPDGRIHGLSDAVELIRAYYLGIPKTPEEVMELLLGVGSRDMEHLLDELYNEMGYATDLTQATRDGGRDIIARKNESGHNLTLYIESKNWAKRVGVKEVRALNGVIEKAQIEKGLIVGMSGFSRGKGSATEFADELPRIDLLDGYDLIKLLSETYGRNWPQNIDRIIGRSKQREFEKQVES